jgi:hypothetical protein
MANFSLKSPNLFLSCLIISLSFFPLPTLASKVEVAPKETNGEKVTIKVKVLGDQKIPVEGLKKENLSIDTERTDQKIPLKNLPNNEIIDFKQPNQTTPDPADIVILLDMSGSMRRPVASGKDGGMTKLKGATDAIREFLNGLKEEKLPFNVAIVPFAFKTIDNCGYTYDVNPNILKENLLPVNSGELDAKLNELSGINVCGATNLYDPVKTTVEYLGDRKRLAEINKDSWRNNPFVKWFTQSEEDPQIPPRKLAVILLSDGFHVYQRQTETEQFDSLKQTLKAYPSVTVHTLGYGESLKNLRDRATCNSFIGDQDLESDQGIELLRSQCSLGKAIDGKAIDINEFIVDENRLKEIAKPSGGIPAFSDNAQEVAQSLKTVLTSLREYEVTFNMPDSDRGSSHEVILTINEPQRNLNNIKSSSTKIGMSNFVYKSLPPYQRLFILMITATVGGIGIFTFRFWSQNLKKQAKLFLVVFGSVDKTAENK